MGSNTKKTLKNLNYFEFFKNILRVLNFVDAKKDRFP